MRVLRYICHGDSSREVDSPGSLPDDDSLAVVMLNDHYTEMIVVVEILKKAFDMDVGAAYRTMMTVHQRGRAVLGPFPRDEALGRLERAIGILEQKQAPLRLIVAAPDDLGPAD